MCYIIYMNKEDNMDLKKLTHKELVNLWVSAQGDVTVPPNSDVDRGGDKELVNRCFTELCNRAVVRHPKEKANR